MRSYSCGTTYKSINVNIITKIVVAVTVVVVEVVAVVGRCCRWHCAESATCPWEAC